MITIEIPAWVAYATSAFIIVNAFVSSYRAWLTLRLKNIEEEKLLALKGQVRVNETTTRTQRRAHAKKAAKSRGRR